MILRNEVTRLLFEKLNGEILLIRNDEDGFILSDPQSALDLIGAIWGEGQYTKLIIMKEDISENFFDLKTRIAGEILQKFMNYGFRLAIVGDFQKYTSKSLKDFIYESNKGKMIYFADSVADAALKLSI